MKRYCLTLDLKDDEALIQAYEAHHKKVWPEVLLSIKEAGVISMEIYRYGTRLCMIMEVKDSFSFSAKNAADAANPKVLEWEALMWQYQQPLPTAVAGEKWVIMNKIFEVNN